MTVSLLVSLLASAPPAPPAPPAAVRSDDPPVEVSLNQDGYFRRGDRARVRVRVREDGYLLVLLADADNRVRVLFPLDPGDDAFVRGGRKVEVRGRGDREAFYVDEREGSGVVLAAQSATPFRFDEFVRSDHWDYRVLGVSIGGGDKEAALVDIVQRMMGDGTFQYDAVNYTVEPHGAYYRRFYPSVRLHIGFGYGWPRHRYWFARGSCFDPFFYDAWYCGRTYYDPFYYDAFFYDPFYYDPFYYGRYGYYRPYRPIIVIDARPRYRSRLFIDRVGPSVVGRPIVFRDRASAPSVMGVEPRLRIPQGTLLYRGRDARSVPVSSTRPTSEPVRRRDVWSDRVVSSTRPTFAPERRRDDSSDRIGSSASPAEPVRERPSAPERSTAVDRGWDRDRSDGGRGSVAPAPTRREGSRGVERSAPQRSADRGASRGGGWSGGGGGGRSAAAPRSSSGSSGSSRGSAPANGGGRRRS